MGEASTQNTAAPEPPTAESRLIAMLNERFQPLYAILDAARDPRVMKMLLESNEQHQSLYQGESAERLVHFAPYLVRLPKGSPLIEQLVKNGWGKSWGIYLTCDQAFENVRSHFRHFLIVKTESGKDLYFRFYDPRVLSNYLPNCRNDEAGKFFGQITRYAMEDSQPGRLLEFIHQGQEARKVIREMSEGH
jgi:hypothetical protein